MQSIVPTRVLRPQSGDKDASLQHAAHCCDQRLGPHPYSPFVATPLARMHPKVVDLLTQLPAESRRGGRQDERKFGIEVCGARV